MHYVLSDLSIDTTTRTVGRGTKAIKLPDLSFDAFVALIEAAPEPAGTRALTQSVWDAEHVTDETVAQRIALLRKALGDDPKNPTYIRTVRGAGYAIVGTVERTEREPQAAWRTPWDRHRMVAVAAGLIGILLVGSLFLITIKSGSSQTEDFAKATETSEVSLLVTRANQQLGLHQSAETDRAISMLRDALTQEPDSFDARLTLSFALSTKATKFGGGAAQKKEAEALARSLIKERPASSNASRKQQCLVCFGLHTRFSRAHG